MTTIMGTIWFASGIYFVWQSYFTLRSTLPLAKWETANRAYELRSGMTDRGPALQCADQIVND